MNSDAQQSPFMALTADPFQCHVCASRKIHFIKEYQGFHRVTSDCKPWPKGGKLLLCEECGCVQKAIDFVWQREIDEIYTNYSIYHQAEGAEQPVFNQNSGQSASRSSILIEKLSSQLPLPESGRLLDIGCGNGALIRAFSHQFPNWGMIGTELNEKYRSQVESIHGVESMKTCHPTDIDGTFDIITMVHVLEHVPNPVGFLHELRSKLDKQSRLVIEVPNYLRNPFDLLIADHSTHFTADSLSSVVRAAGFHVEFVTSEWIPKELTLVATKSGEDQGKADNRSLNEDAHAPLALSWLERLVQESQSLAKQNTFGIFGTSIAGTWLHQELNSQDSFFVDEDPTRVGKLYMDIPVYHPKDVPLGSLVYLPTPSNLGNPLKCRLQDLLKQARIQTAPALPAP
jgi:SAM-dependent methyltransferase